MIGDKFIVETSNFRVHGYCLKKHDIVEVVGETLSPQGENLVQINNQYFTKPLWIFMVNLTIHCEPMK